jgi:hypothetical protein
MVLVTLFSILHITISFVGWWLLRGVILCRLMGLSLAYSDRFSSFFLRQME